MNKKNDVFFECETCGQEVMKVSICSVCGKIICMECVYYLSYQGYKNDVFCNVCANPNYPGWED